VTKGQGRGGGEAIENKGEVARVAAKGVARNTKKTVDVV